MRSDVGRENSFRPENINKTVVKNITAAFNAIHELGVIHGDVRRQNIMVKADQSVVIIDFENQQA